MRRRRFGRFKRSFKRGFSRFKKKFGRRRRLGVRKGTSFKHHYGILR